MLGCQDGFANQTQLALLSVSKKEWPLDLEQPVLVAEAYLWFLPTGAHTALHAHPAAGQLTLTLLTTAWTSFCPIPLPLSLVTSLIASLYSSTWW